MLLDIHPASISPEDANEDIIPLVPKGRPKNGALKGRPKNGAACSESGDESSAPASKHVSKNESSSDEDLTLMNPEMIQKTLMSKVEPV